MRKSSYFASAGSALALSLIGLVGAANATADETNVQVNVDPQIAITGINNVQVGDTLEIDTSAVGNNVSVISDTPFAGVGSPTRRDNADVRVVSLQVNLAPQLANTIVTNSIVGAIDVNTQAIGNNGEFRSTNANFDPDFAAAVIEGPLYPILVSLQSDGSTGLQFNLANQTAITGIDNVTIYGGADVNTVAVGDNLDWEAGKNGTAAGVQVNLGSQSATTGVNNVRVGGDVDIGTQAIGNSFSLQADAADGLTIQVNAGGSQVAVTSFTNSIVNGGVSVNTGAIGNNVQIHTGNVAP